MGIWALMLAVDLLVPAIMIFAGRGFKKCPPKSINHFYGYRTRMSMKNQDTWVFAHKYCGKLWVKWGFAMLIPTAIAYIVLIGADIESISVAGGVICVLQSLIMLWTIYPTEKALRREFDENGQKHRNDMGKDL